MWSIYLHAFPDGMHYSGQTCMPPEDRWRRGEGYKDNPKGMYKAIQEYGWDNIQHIILKQVNSLEEADYWEQYYIRQYNCIENGYNTETGGHHKVMVHNYEVYNMLEAYLQNDTKALIVIDTGLGKTTTALEYLYQHRCRGLVLVPTNNIEEQWEKEPKVDAMTYAAFANCYNTLDYSQYGCVICDEVHHCVSDKTYGIGIKYLIENKIIPVIGLTATNERTDGIDVGIDLFENNICNGLTLFEGIEQGLIHPFSYVTAMYESGEMVANIIKDKQVEECLIGRLNIALNNTPTAHNIISKHLEGKRRKGIIFVHDINSTEEAVEFIHSIYPNDKCYILHSEQPKEIQCGTRSWFEQTEEGWLVNVQMVSEGSHYPGVTAIIGLRKTQSYLLFRQQLGRIIALTKYENPNAVVFDLVNNAYNLGKSREFLRKLKQSIGNHPRQEGQEPFVSDQYIVKDYTEDLMAILEEIKYSFVHKAVIWRDYGDGLRFRDVNECAFQLNIIDGIEVTAEGIAEACRNDKKYKGLSFTYATLSLNTKEEEYKYQIIDITNNKECKCSTLKELTQITEISREKIKKYLSGNWGEYVENNKKLQFIIKEFKGE